MSVAMKWLLSAAAVPAAVFAVSAIEAQCAKCVSGACQWGPLAPPAYADCMVLGGTCYNSVQKCGGDETLEFAAVDFGLDGLGALNDRRASTILDRASGTQKVRIHCSGIVVGLS